LRVWKACSLNHAQDCALAGAAPSLGQSVESCNENKLSDCTDQLQSDVRFAAGTSP
jgi:hypothetical protein